MSKDALHVIFRGCGVPVTCVHFLGGKSSGLLSCGAESDRWSDREGAGRLRLSVETNPRPPQGECTSREEAALQVDGLVVFNPPPSPLPQASLTMSNRQRYYLSHRKGGPTSICLVFVSKDMLKSKETYRDYVKSLLSECE